jgi:hypothetical protein
MPVEEQSDRHDAHPELAGRLPANFAQQVEMNDINLPR